MAITGAKPGGSFYELDNVANDGAVLAFKVREFKADRMLTATSTRPVSPVVVDLVVLGKFDAASGRFAPCVDHMKVVRGEEIVGAGITGSLRRSAIGDDVIAVMGWGRHPQGTNYVQANAPEQAVVEAAIAVFTATNGDPYTAAERAAAPAATVVAATPAPAAAPPAPAAAPPAPTAPAVPAVDPGLGAAPWSAPAEPVAAGVGAAASNGTPPW